MAHSAGLFLILIFFHFQRTFSQDSFTKLDNLNVIELQKTEEQMLPDLDSYIADKEEHLHALEEIINQTKVTANALTSQSVENYLGHPINQYLVIKRFYESWGKLGEFLSSDSAAADLRSQINKYRNDHKFPGKVDLYSALTDLEKSPDIDPEPEGHRVLF